MRKNILTAAAGTAFAASLALAAPATAAVTFDPATGSGFVGKGDVQLAFTLNNSQLQTQAGNVAFTSTSEKTEEVFWECTNVKNEKIQEREQTVTTSTSKVVSSVARDNKKQVTGFNLAGYGAITETSTTVGPQKNTCPTNWVLTTPAGDPVLVSSTTPTLIATLNGVAVTLA